MSFPYDQNDKPAGTVRGGAISTGVARARTEKTSDPSTRKASQFQTLGSLLERFALDDKGGRISREFQDYAYRLAVDLNDMAHKSLYMKLAKSVDRRFLEQARTFVLDANANSRAKLFMWKLSQIRKEAKANDQKKASVRENKE